MISNTALVFIRVFQVTQLQEPMWRPSDPKGELHTRAEMYVRNDCTYGD